ncbi:hypothetical protein [uncultured Microbacterium sp.]|uniref:Adenylate kinase n=1 Tax=uncultured Microbacterium sp. TaxID=191216 RepID=A0A1Y5NZI5_9MICO|nr:hypothetical protein [uncultured Microbacterium sp.]SBS70710.1 Adenylate kinase [uncultured Microbacterium sp.]
MRSSADPVARALTAAADLLATAHLGARVTLIDGRSGAGKTTLAALLSARRPGVQVLALDALYPGWDGLAEGVDAVLHGVLEPLARGEQGRWRRWDWAADRPAEGHVIDPERPLIVEGSGILTPRTASLADVRVWLRSPAASRKDRALARDGDVYRAQWDRWAGQEDRHLRADHPERWATHVVDVP